MGLKIKKQVKKKEPFDYQLLVRRILLVMYDVFAIFLASSLTILLRFNTVVLPWTKRPFMHLRKSLNPFNFPKVHSQKQLSA